MKTSSISARIAELLRDPRHYIVAPELEQTIEIAKVLGQPLLLTGEPGTGKTSLAKHLAAQLPKKIADCYEEFHAKSNSVSSDLFYRYDALQHFQYSHHPGNEKKQVEDFIHFQALGKAINEKREIVVLIDEIDKAPRDFPNDLLNALDQFAFEVPELGKTGSKKIVGDRENLPFVVITSNSEKNLPDAFLRRCVYFHIKFPEKEQLFRILQKLNLSNYLDNELELLVEHFLSLRSKPLRKLPATAEFLAWSAVLNEYEIPADKLAYPEKLPQEQRLRLQAANGILLKTKEDLKNGAS